MIRGRGRPCVGAPTKFAALTPLSWLYRFGPWAAVASAVLWGLGQWRSELTAVPYLDDSSVHEQMVRFASRRMAEGHSPYTSWFPYLGLGSPQFLHYQGLGATLSGALGVMIGGNVAFRWTLYLLLALWPLCVYLSARVFGLSRWSSAAATVLAPFLVSAIGVGYEPKAYVWIGWGVWTQLWASWTLPFAWAFSWRAMSSLKAVVPAAVFVAVTVALHFETGYLALGGVVVIALFSGGVLRRRIGRAGLVVLGALCASAWVTVPLVLSGRWAATNEVLAHTPLVNGYGAKRVLSWLVTGRLYDAFRLPVVTLLVGVGIVVCVARWRLVTRGRVILGLWAMSLVLSFGRTTFGVLTVLIPGSTDLFMRRFMMGAQLAGLYLAGIGAATLARALVTSARRGFSWTRTASGSWGIAGVMAGLALLALWPVWSEMNSYAVANSQAIQGQNRADILRDAQIAPIVAYVKAHGGGRVYAGMPSNWGSEFTVGSVPVFKYLESVDVDEVGYTLRTASLMTDPEYYFDENNPGDFALFGIRYLLLPVGRPPSVPVNLVMTSGPYRLFVLGGNGYIRVVDTVGTLTANRTNVGTKSVAYLRSELPETGDYLTVAFDGMSGAPPTAAGAKSLGSPGRVVATQSWLADGQVRTAVVLHRSAVVVLSASYDPGWTVRVDGKTASTQMLAPALLGVQVGPGRHVVVFTYRGYSGYPELWALAVLTLVGFLWLCWWRPVGPRRLR